MRWWAVCISGGVIAALLLIYGLTHQSPAPEAACLDALAEFATPHPSIIFSHCNPALGAQTMMEAVYHVPIADYERVANFLQETYNMPALQWRCCGLETGPGFGQFTLTPDQVSLFPVTYPEHPEWTVGLISMSAAVDLEQFPNADISDIKNFGIATVTVTIAES